MRAYLHGSHTRKDGTRDSFWTKEVQVKTSELDYHIKPRSFRCSNMGVKIPSVYMVLFNGKWRRVYKYNKPDGRKTYIGKLTPFGENILVSFGV